MAEVKIYKEDSLVGIKPNSVVAIKVPNENKFQLYVTDINGVPYSLKSYGTGGGIESIVNSDGNLTITGTDNINIDISLS